MEIVDAIKIKRNYANQYSTELHISKLNSNISILTNRLNM